MLNPVRIAALSIAAASLALGGCAKQIQPPAATASAGALEVPVGAVVTLDASQSTDPNDPAQPLFFQWAFKALPAGSEARLNDATIVNPSFTADVAGAYTVVLVARNAKVASEPSEVTVTAGPCGASAPTVSAAAASPESPGIGQVVQLSATVADADLDAPCSQPQALAYDWAIASLPAGSLAALNQRDAINPSFTVDVAGDYALRLVVTDSTGRASQPLLFTVTASNCGGNAPSVEQPVASPAAPNVGQVVQLSAAASDADNEEGCAAGQELGFKWFFVALPTGSHAAFNDAELESASFVPDLPGDYVVRVRVTDGTGRDAVSAPATLAVSPCGGATPVVSAIAAGPASPNAGQIVQLTATVEDADSLEPCLLPQSFGYEWTLAAQPAGSEARLNNRVASNPSLLADVPGEYLVELVVTDGSGLRSFPGRFTFTVSSCGAAVPVAAVDLPANAAIGSLLQAAAVVTDADTEAPCLADELFAYAWAFESLPVGSAAALNALDVAAPSFVPDVAGDYVLRLVATDAAGHPSLPAFATVAVSACGGNPPLAQASASPTDPGLNEPVLLTAAATDADNDPVCGAGQSFSFRWAFESLPAGSRAALNSATAISPSFVPDVAGDYVVRLVATDSTGRQSEPATLTVSASGCGGAMPVATASASPAAPALGQPVLLAATVTDADNDAGCEAGQSFTYRWSFESLPAGSGAALNDASAVQPSFVPDVAGDYGVRLVVTDSTGKPSLPATVAVTANGCGGNAPSATVAFLPASIGVGTAVQLEPAVTDADNDPACGLALPQYFSFAWTLLSAPAGSQAALSGASARMPSFVADAPGDYVVRLVVTDSAGLASAPVETTVTAGACGTNPPTAVVLASPPVVNPGEPVSLTATFDDADNSDPACQAALPAPQTHSYQWRLVSAPAGSHAGIARADSLSASLVPDVPGGYQVELVITDSRGNVSEGMTAAFVDATTCGTAAPLLAPALAPGSALHVGGLVGVLANAADPDEGCRGTPPAPLFFQWWLAEVPMGSRAWLDNPMAADVSFTPDVAGSYVLAVAAMDADGNRSETTFYPVNVDPCGGNAPVAVITAPVDVVAGTLVQVDALGAGNESWDPDVAGCGLAQELGFQWEIFTAPIGSHARLQPSQSASNPWFTADQPGTYVVRLRAWDSTGLVSEVASATISAN